MWNSVIEQDLKIFPRRDRLGLKPNRVIDFAVQIDIVPRSPRGIAGPLFEKCLKKNKKFNVLDRVFEICPRSFGEIIMTMRG